MPKTNDPLTAYLKREKAMKAKAKKNAVPLDEDLQTIIICAIRYSLGRQTYMPELVTRWIIENCAGKLYKGRIKVMLRDIQEQREMGERSGWASLGDPCDVRTWEKFEAWLFEQKERASDE